MEVGNRYNKFIVLETSIKSDSRTWVRVQCDCGWLGLRREDHLKSGRTKSCKKCSAKITTAIYGTPQRNRYVGEFGRTYYSKLKQSAAIRGLDFDVTQEFLWDLFISQKSRCALSGLDINLSTKLYKSNPDYSAFTASLDRIDSSKGYLVDNVQWVHKDINRLKNNLDETKLIYLCSLIYNHANQQPS